MRKALTAIPFLLVLTGCGHYSVTFRPQDVINAPGDDNTRERLDIDVVVLGQEEAERHPDIANGAMKSNTWFAARRGDSGAPPIGDIPPGKIFSLRGRDAATYRGYGNDQVIGNPLSSVRDGGAREVAERIRHSQFMEKHAAIVVYGRFHDGKGGELPTDPVVFKPPPHWKTDIVIGVGRTSLSRISPPP